MKFREHMNKAVFGLIAAALQLLPGQSKADDIPKTCPEEEETLLQVYQDCTSQSTACECLDCIQSSGFVSAQQDLNDCLGGESLLQYCGYFTTFCNMLSGGEQSQSGNACSSGSGSSSSSGSGSGGSSSSSGN